MNSFEDKIWLDGKRRLDAICSDAIKTGADGVNVLILAHFKSTLTAVEDHLGSRLVEYRLYLPVEFSSLCARGDESESSGIWVGLASFFRPRSPAPAERSQSSLRILIAEHHPIASRDQSLLEAASTLSCNTQVIYYTSLQDPLLIHFGGEKLRGLMKQLGMEEQDCISHPMISRAIRNAQEKIERRVQLEVQTVSPEEWFKFNLPPNDQYRGSSFS